MCRTLWEIGYSLIGTMRSWCEIDYGQDKEKKSRTTVWQFNFYFAINTILLPYWFHGCKMLRANWRPLFFIYLDHVPIPGRLLENGHGDQKAEDDHQVGQLTVVLCLSSTNSFIKLDRCMLLYLITTDVLQCAKVNNFIDNREQCTRIGQIHFVKSRFLYLDLRNLSRKDPGLVRRIVITDKNCKNDKGKALVYCRPDTLLCDNKSRWPLIPLLLSQRANKRKYCGQREKCTSSEIPPTEAQYL